MRVRVLVNEVTIFLQVLYYLKVNFPCLSPRILPSLWHECTVQINRAYCRQTFFCSCFIVFLSMSWCSVNQTRALFKVNISFAENNSVSVLHFRELHVLRQGIDVFPALKFFSFNRFLDSVTCFNCIHQFFDSLFCENPNFSVRKLYFRILELRVHHYTSVPRQSPRSCCPDNQKLVILAF